MADFCNCYSLRINILNRKCFGAIGEHDKREDDETYIDVPVARGKAHSKFPDDEDLNDIGVLYLEYDVTFTGELQSVFKKISKFLFNSQT